jgi:hypothetical protein
MSDQDKKTLADGKTTLELVLDRLGELSADTKQALAESREANLMASSNNAMLKSIVARRASPTRLLRAAVPYAALLAAVVALIRAW